MSIDVAERQVASPAPSETPTIATVSSTADALTQTTVSPTMARTYYAGYRGSEPVQLWLHAVGPAVFEGELSGLTFNPTPVHAAYKALLNDEQWPATGMVTYQGEITGVSVEQGFVFALWRGPDDDVAQLPNDFPEEVLASSGAQTMWLSKVGNEEALSQHQQFRQKLIDASQRRVTTCGLRLRIEQVVEAQGTLGAVAYYLANLCPPQSGSQLDHEEFFVATLDAQGQVSDALSLGDPTFDYESAAVLRLELSGQVFFGVRRDWAKRAGGRAAATADGWLLGVDRHQQLRIAASLGHGDINAPDTPSNHVAEISVADIDEQPPHELMLDQGGVISIYHAAKASGYLVRVPTRLPKNIDEHLSKGTVAWPH